MNRIFSAITICLLTNICGYAQLIREPNNMRAGSNSMPTTMSAYDGVRLERVTKRTDGYIVYNYDTIKGYVELSNKDVLLEQPLNDKYSRFYEIKLKNTNLQTIVMYNYDRKPFYLTRVSPKDKQMMRLVHEGKLNIYDDRLQFIYNPKDIDRNLIVVKYDSVVDDLGSFLTESTKRDLIGYVNDIYGLKLDPKALTWKELLRKVDELD